MYSSAHHIMKFYPRLGLYKSSNCEFNPSTLESRSYGWWLVTRKIGDMVVFNDY